MKQQLEDMNKKREELGSLENKLQAELQRISDMLFRGPALGGMTAKLLAERDWQTGFALNPFSVAAMISFLDAVSM